MTETWNDCHKKCSSSSLGIQLSVDDFGSGHFSLAYLKCFPIHTLKINRHSSAIAINRDDTSIFSSFLSLAHHLKLNVIAEGVKTQSQMAICAISMLLHSLKIVEI